MLRHRLAEARKSDNGFTLIELLIVIVVLGILAGIVVFGVGTFRTDATKAAACANTKAVQVAGQAYLASTNAPAANIAALVTANYLKTTPNPLPVYATTGTPATDFTVTPPTGVTCP